MAESKGDPKRGVVVWTFGRVRPHFLGWVLAYLAAPVLTEAFAALSPPTIKGGPQSSFLHRLATGIDPSLKAFALITACVLIYVFVIAPYQQRRALRDCLGTEAAKVKERDSEIERLKVESRERKLDKDHEDDIRMTLTSMRDQILQGKQLGIEQGARKALAGHVPTVPPLVDVFATHKLIDVVVADNLTARSRNEIEKFDRHVYVHGALATLYDSAFYRAATLDAGVLPQIEWEPLNEIDNDEVRMMRGEHAPPMRVGIANASVSRKQIMERVQAFFDDVGTWEEVVKYADVARIDAMIVARTRLLDELDQRIEQFGYVVGVGCVRCPA